MQAVLNHVWQSTLFVVSVWALALILRGNRAALRYWLWFAASVKFLIPFAPLFILGNQFEWRTQDAAAPQTIHRLTHSELVMPQISMPAGVQVDWARLLFAVWLLGFAVSLATWFLAWKRIRSLHRAATPLPLALPIPALSTPARIEPGIFGVRKPILLLPDGITDRLTPAQLQAVLAHELCHVRRRDNLTGAIHMVVEAIFWFYPLVRFLRSRLVEERERACDEEVLAQISDPDGYAESILTMCKFYLESPMICASGIAGADLKKRIEEIVGRKAIHRLDWRRKTLLAMSGLLALASPIAIGIWNAPPLHAQTAAGAQAFDVASIKVNHTGAKNSGFKRFIGGALNATNITPKMLISFAYDISQDQIFEGPSWIESERYDIVAKLESATQADQSMAMIRRRTQSLLADRFKLNLRKESRQLPIFALQLANGGPKHLEPPEPGSPDLVTNGHHVAVRHASLEFFARVFLAGQAGRHVVDQTGIKGEFDFAMDWTPDEAPPTDDPTGPSLFTALQQQLGLKLVPTKGPVDVLVVGHIEKATEN